MIIIDLPSFFIFLKTLNNFSISLGVKTAVGSSRINVLAPLYKVLTISNVCFSETDISYTFLFKSRTNPYLDKISLTNSLAIFNLDLFLSSIPKTIFSKHVNVSINLKC